MPSATAILLLEPLMTVTSSPPQAGTASPAQMRSTNRIRPPAAAFKEFFFLFFLLDVAWFIVQVR
jgi:hypothetical protein